MKSLYEAIKTRSIAYITLNAIPLELQLPPHLDDLLHNEDLDPDSVPAPYDEKTENWGPELSTGWKLPELAPWKSLMLLDATDDSLEDPMASFRGPHVSAEDRALAEKLMRFMENVSVTLSLADMGSLLDWDLEQQVYPVVRWLVQHRRAKVVDVVNPGLKTVFALPRQFPSTPPLAVLAKEFGAQFSHPEVPSLPKILSIVSSPTVSTKSHFFASVVKSKELIPMYHDVVSWMLKRDLLIILHLRIRVVATVEIKERVWAKRQEKLRRKGLAASTLKKAHRTSRSYGGDAAALVSSTWLPQSILNPRYSLSHSHSHSHSSHRSSQKSKSSRRRSSADSKRGANMSIQEEDEVSPRGLGFFNNSVFDDVNEDSGSGHSGYRFDVERGSSSNSSSRGPSSVAYDSMEENGKDGGDEEDEEDGGSEETLAEFAAGASSADPDSSVDRFRASMIEDPGRATALQAKWLSAMSEGKDTSIRKKFEK